MSPHGRNKTQPAGERRLWGTGNSERTVRMTAGGRPWGQSRQTGGSVKTWRVYAGRRRASRAATASPLPSRSSEPGSGVWTTFN